MHAFTIVYFYANNPYLNLSFSNMCVCIPCQRGWSGASCACWGEYYQMSSGESTSGHGWQLGLDFLYSQSALRFLSNLLSPAFPIPLKISYVPLLSIPLLKSKYIYVYIHAPINTNTYTQTTYAMACVKDICINHPNKYICTY